MYLNRLALSLLASLVLSCVTVNVNFPESTVQKATDDYVEELYKAKQQAEHSGSEEIVDQKSSPPAKSSKPKKAVKQDSTMWIWPSLINEARADIDLEFKTKTPKSSAIQARQASRLQQLMEYMGKPHFAIGEGSDGYLVSKNETGLMAGQKMIVKKLIRDENKDREELYAEIVSANGFTKEKLPQIQKSFARSFQKNAPIGTWIQAETGDWVQKN